MSQPQAGESGDPRLGREPRCPACRWRLAFCADEGHWAAYCGNESCAVNRIEPPRLWEAETLEALRSGANTTTDLAATLGLKLPAVNMRLAALLSAGLVERKLTNPKRGGRLFVYETVVR